MDGWDGVLAFRSARDILARTLHIKSYVDNSIIHVYRGREGMYITAQHSIAYMAEQSKQSIDLVARVPIGPLPTNRQPPRRDRHRRCHRLHCTRLQVFNHTQLTATHYADAYRTIGLRTDQHDALWAVAVRPVSIVNARAHCAGIKFKDLNPS